MGLHIIGLNVWFCRNDPKVSPHAFALPPGANEIGAVLSELPGHVTLAYDVPDGIALRMSEWIVSYFKAYCVRGPMWETLVFSGPNPLLPCSSLILT